MYSIVNRNGDSIPFRLNPVQNKVALSVHNRKLILKARQLGMSTFAVLSILDDAIFNPNLACGIVSYSLEHAQHIFKRIIGHALDTFHPEIKSTVGIISRSAREITFKNGSFLRVDTSLRGGAYPCVLVSEFGKTCARSPLKAEEVITGTLQAVPANGKIIIESTGEGNEGFFADMVYSASQRGNENLSELDYELFFFPWFDEPSYKLAQDVSYPVELTDYFDDLQRKQNRTIDRYQRNWYAQQFSLLGDKIRQEFPSTVAEAFLSNSDAYYYALGIEKAYKESRVLESQLYDCLFPVYVAMDIGATDLTVIVFFQVIHSEIRIIDMYSDTGKGVDFYSRFLLNDKPYIINTIFLPHDAGHRDGIIVENTYEKEFKKVMSHTNTRFIILKRNDINLGISQARLLLDRCVFARKRTKDILDHLSKYRKKWSEATGRYLDEPYHDIHSHFADAFRYAMQAVTHLETSEMTNQALTKHKKVVDNRRLLI